MNWNQTLLRKIGVSHASLESVINIAIENGALGAKLTGGGLGGCAIALAESKKDQKRISYALNERGYPTIEHDVV